MLIQTCQVVYVDPDLTGSECWSRPAKYFVDPDMPGINVDHNLADVEPDLPGSEWVNLIQTWQVVNFDPGMPGREC
jgi:hypothetical protein